MTFFRKLIAQSAELGKFAKQIGAVLLEFNVFTEPDESKRVFEAIAGREKRFQLDFSGKCLDQDDVESSRCVIQ